MQSHRRRVREPAARLARSLLEGLGDTFDLLYDFAQPYSIALICEMLSYQYLRRGCTTTGSPGCSF